jgi:hypothetical protein
MQVVMKKSLTLNKKTISVLNNEQLAKITGGVADECTNTGFDEFGDSDEGEDGFLSIGHECSCNNTCGRLTRRGECFCCCPSV